jgi:hypothetical protein
MLAICRNGAKAAAGSLLSSEATRNTPKRNCNTPTLRYVKELAN